MNLSLILGTRIVVLALIAYSVGIITEQRKHVVSNIVISFLTAGILLDITATVFMIIGSGNTPFTLHGMLGYSSLAAMLVDTILIWRQRIRYGPDEKVRAGLHIYSRLAYIWWILAFITGGLLVLMK